MNTCENCQWWKKGPRFPRDGADEAHLVQTGICDNEEAFPMFWHGGSVEDFIRVNTWFDFTCAHHKPKPLDRAEALAKSICQTIINEGITERTREEVARLIREDAAKAKNP